MKILIIGGTGNISSAITRELVAEGHDVTHFRRESKPAPGLKNIRVIRGDRTDRADFKAKLKEAGPFEAVIDMVCYEPDDARCDVEILAGRTRQLIFCSTVDVYTKTPASYPVTEANGQLGAKPSFPYGYKKMLCEEILWEAHSRGDFALTAIRPSFTYNETWSPGIHSFGAQTYHLDRIRKGKPIILHGDGTSLWVATYRDDVARTFVAALGNEAAFGQAYHLAGDEWMTHNYIWRTIAQGLNAPDPNFVYIPTDLLARLVPKEAEWCLENFQHNNVFDTAKAKRDLGFRYTVPFADGVARCLAHLNAHGAIEDSAKHPFYDRIVEVWQEHALAMTDDYRGKMP
jgi:nucleoside-diphosphate-sugar epimerase